MFDPTQLFKLTESQQAQADAMETFITDDIAAHHAASPTATSFTFKTAEIAKTIKGLEIVARNHVIELHKEAGWKVDFDEATGEITLTAKKPRKARKPKEVVAPVPAE